MLPNPRTPSVTVKASSMIPNTQMIGFFDEIYKFKGIDGRDDKGWELLRKNEWVYQNYLDLRKTVGGKTIEETVKLWPRKKWQALEPYRKYEIVFEESP